MVLFPLQREAAIEALELGKTLGCAVWLGADAVTDAEYERYGSEGVKVSRFIYRLSNAPQDAVDEALETIVLHHPEKRCGCSTVLLLIQRLNRNAAGWRFWN